MGRTVIRAGERFDAATEGRIVADFRRDGYALLRGVLAADEVAALIAATDRLLADPEARAGGYVQKDFILRHCNELDPVFCDLLIREPILGLMDSIFGPGCQQCGMNVLRTDRANAIDQWHVDDDLFFPLPASVPRHDPRIEMPVPWLTVQVALTDVDTEAHGPTQYVPGSHYSGRRPATDGPAPTFEGRGPEPIFCRAGDVYLHNSQCWHRGAPNRSDRVRYLLQAQYGPAWAFPRYNAYIRHELPASLLEGAGERLRGVLGAHRLQPAQRYR